MAASDTSSPARAVSWLRTGEEGLETMLQALNRARQTVRLETYTFEASPLGHAFRAALTAACQRGVVVRVLIDAIGSVELPDSFWKPLRAAGGTVRWFNPLNLKRITYRDHRKMLVVDDELAVIGGFNIATSYQGDGVAKGWRDLGVKVAGPMVLELGASFDSMFRLADFKHPRLQRLRKGGLVRAVAKPNWALLLSGPGRGHGLLKKRLAGDLAAAASIVVVSAYFLPTWRIRRELKRRARRGARVRLILAGKSDVGISQMATRRLYHGLLRAGIEVYEYQPQILHAKLVIADSVVYVGSANLDMRGLGINYELLARVDDRKLAEEGAEIIGLDLKRCRRINLAEWHKSRGFLEKLMENLSYFLLARLDPFLARWQWRRWGWRHSFRPGKQGR